MEVGRTAEYDTGSGTVMDKDGKSPKVSYGPAFAPRDGVAAQ